MCHYRRLHRLQVRGTEPQGNLINLTWNKTELASAGSTDARGEHDRIPLSLCEGRWTSQNANYERVKNVRCRELISSGTRNFLQASRKYTSSPSNSKLFSEFLIVTMQFRNSRKRESQKKQNTWLHLMLTGFHNFSLTDSLKFAIKSLLNFPPHLKRVATLRYKISKLKNCHAQRPKAAKCDVRLSHSKMSYSNACQPVRLTRVDTEVKK